MIDAQPSSIANVSHYGDAPFFVFCDHASNSVPADLHCLGLPSDLLGTHIAWDIGARALSHAVTKRLGGVLLECGFSRLVVDVNRDVKSPDLIPAASDQIPVPGNQMLSDGDRAKRITAFHAPYHQMLGEALDDAQAKAPGLFAVSIHSFTDRLMGAADDRPWPVGLLWREDERSAKAVIENLQRHTDWLIGDNEPYDARVFNYSVDRHIGPRGLAHITLEVRQDMIGDAEGVDMMASIISGAIRFAAHTHMEAGVVL